MNTTPYVIGTVVGDESSSAAMGWWSDLVGFCEARQELLVPIGILLVAALVINIIQAWLLSRFARRMDTDGFRWSSIFASSISRPIGLLIWLCAVTIAIQWFVEPDAGRRAESLAAIRVGQIRTGLVLLLIGWFVTRMIRRYEAMLAEPCKSGAKVDITIIRALSNFFSVLVWLSILLVGLQTYGVNMTAIVTLGGASSFALTFAFQDVFKNLFGGIMILFSRPFKIGDGIELGSKGIAGSVERIGLYQTCLRGWDNVPIVLPNSIFLTDPIMNLSAATHRRVRFDIGLRYDDFDQVKAVGDEVTEMLQSHDEVDESATIRVVFTNYGASSLDLQLTCHSLPGYSSGQAAFLKQDIMLKVGGIVTKHGADFAFPTTTIDLPVGTKSPV